ncbi:MAG: uroporphyrinogen-III C-methyltransferase [Cyanobacteria bacterium SID2]|nr:uroporphyrinogen-III C-methyltransferase [Cyanobacteria bacterium SID2]MBP0005408.1 uroporphyrinogen-III C-methyltransferase [Cyanobacteria bacterium SBC]
MKTVYIVGAGLGDVDYLTVRGRRLLTRADVLIYDALADDRLLEWVPSSCLCLDVGKRGGKPSTPQSDIDRLLVAYCTQGKQVVRLKAGDPFVFGRSASEIRALKAANCPFEVVPGISSVLAAPLLAGIPLTDTQLSSGFAASSAHDPDALPWDALAQLDTLVFLMGGRKLAAICQRLTQAGKLPQTPIAIVRWAGRSQQRVWTGTLDNIVNRTAGESLSPAVIVVGEVVQLRDALWCDVWNTVEESMVDETRPLAGKTVLVTRSTGQSSDFQGMLSAAGANALSTPALEIGPPSSWEALDAAIDRRSEFDWVIFSSSNGVDFLFDRLQNKGLDARALAGLKIAVVGRKTAKSLDRRGLQPDFIPPDFVADSLVEHFPEPVAGRRFLCPRVETGGRELLMRQFTEAGAQVTMVPAYESRCPAALTPEALSALRQGTVDVVTFASSKTVKNFDRLVEAAGGISLEKVALASIGPQTTESCLKYFDRCDLEAEEFTIDGLYQSIVRWADSRSTRSA